MIAIGCDHGGFDLKNSIIKHLEQQNIEVKDFGCYSLQSVDYPDFAQAVAKSVAIGECVKGIVICSTGIGVSIAANKVKGIRCALVHDLLSARLTREHNDSNVLAMGAFIVAPETAKQITDIWLNTEFSGGERHLRRVGKITKIESDL